MLWIDFRRTSPAFVQTSHRKTCCAQDIKGCFVPIVYKFVAEGTGMGGRDYQWPGNLIQW